MLSTPASSGSSRLWRHTRGETTGQPIERILFAYARILPKAFFVQIGSNDGIHLDPLRASILRHRWSGIMVEPVPHLFDRLRQQYGDREGIRLENAAVAEADGVRRLYYLPPAEDATGLPPWYETLGSFRKDVVLRHRTEIPDIEERLTSLMVPCLTFDALCAKHGASHVDLVHTDTEGFDDVIVRSIDLGRYRPSLLLFEHFHMERPTYWSLTEHVSSFGYECIPVGMDTVALQASGLGRGRRRLLHLWKELSNRSPEIYFRDDRRSDENP